jgi:hypothetical protein
MIFDSVDVIVYTAYFLVPGFFIAEIMNAIMPGKRRSDAENVLVYLGYSILNFACWFWAYYLLDEHFKNRTFLYWLVLVMAAMTSAIITGCITGIIRMHNPIRWIIGKLGYPFEYPIPMAWDYKFSNMKEGRYLTVCLDDGSMIRGAFFNKSLASSDGQKMDIFLETVYMLENEKWKPVEGSDGVWISSTAIKWISFWTEGGIEND